MANFIDRATRAELEREAEEKKREDYERQKQDLLAAANALFEKHSAYSKAEIQIYDQSTALQAAEPLDSLEKGSEGRLVRMLKALDIRCEAYLQLVSDPEHLKAFRQKLNWFVWESWMHFYGFPLEMVPAPHPTTPLNEHQDKAKRFWDRAQHWYIEGHRRLDKLGNPSGPNGTAHHVRRGYRREIDGWMKREGISGLDEARRRLHVSLDILKSIRSDKGRLRCSQETLERVLKIIGPSPSD